MLCSIQFDYARDAELVNVVRKDLAMALKALFQHGLVRVSAKVNNKVTKAYTVTNRRSHLQQGVTCPMKTLSIQDKNGNFANHVT